MAGRGTPNGRAKIVAFTLPQPPLASQKTGAGLT